MGLVAASLDIFFALVLLGAALHKLVSFNRLAAASARLAGVSAAFGPILTCCAAAWEVTSALAILFEPSRPLGLAAAAVLWGAYAVLTWRVKLRGQAFDCGCTFGSAGRGADPLTVPRAAGLSLAAAGLALLPVPPQFGVTAILAGLAFLGLLVAAGELAAVIPMSRRLSQ